jgi:hypothetical protein
MRRPEEVERVRALARGGLNNCQIARLTGIPRGTVRDWVRGRTRVPRSGGCPGCGHPPHRFDLLPPREYAYLLGVYLGDGTISRAQDGVSVLRVFQDSRYPRIVGEIVRAMRAVMPRNRVHVLRRGTTNCVEIVSRLIQLTAWQWAIVCQEPGMFVRGLIHSDGCRVINRVIQSRYAYPRYFFTNHSLDIQQLFREACDIIGIEYRNNRWHTISVAKRESVALLDAIVGPKR